MSAKTFLCSTCIQDFRKTHPTGGQAPVNLLRLDEPTGAFQCAEGHRFTPEEMVAADKQLAASLQKKKPKAIHASQGGQKSTHPRLAAARLGPARPSSDNLEAKTPEIVSQIGELGENYLDHIEDNQNNAFSTEPVEGVADAGSQIRHKLTNRPNGDVAVEIEIPECYVGCCTELAGDEGQTLDVWMSELLNYRLEEIFGGVRR